MTDEEKADILERIRPYVERARTLSGWSFDEDIAPRQLGPALTWDYEALATGLLKTASSVLDMGTGGGEVFGKLCAAYRGRAVATEEWHVNVPFAAKLLKPLRIEVVHCKSVRLPFHSDVFDLALNRHEELDPAEAARVLTRGGTLLTEQVGRDNWRELRRFLPRMRDFGPLFEQYQSEFKASGLNIVQARTHDAKVAFPGLGEIAFMLCATPWTIPGFDPLGRDIGSLIDVERNLLGDEGIILTESLFMIEAQKSIETKPVNRT